MERSTIMNLHLRSSAMGLLSAETVVSPASNSKQKVKKHSSSSKKEKGSSSSSSKQAKKKKQEEEAAPAKPRRNLFQHLRSSMSSQPRRASMGTVSTVDSSAAAEGLNVVQWMHQVCPDDVMPHIFAFCGPQKTRALQGTAKYFDAVMQREETWQVLCEELYKWKPTQEQPTSWKDYYCSHPCVPTDFSTINRALAAAAGGVRKHQDRSVTVLLRPGVYHCNKAVWIEGRHRMVHVSIQTLDLPTQFLPQGNRIEGLPFLLDPSRAALVSKSRRRNEPLIRVLQGELSVKNVSLHHHSMGVDIWSGNAAVQIRPVPQEIGHAPTRNLPRASVFLDNVEVTSASGRGIVAMEDSLVTMTNSYVHDCAATGVYVGGVESKVTLKSCDITSNGTGNQRSGGIARGHSGMYVERGVAVLDGCNVSQNSAAGISVISGTQARLELNGCDVVSNGGTPLEIPVGHEISENNRVSVIGTSVPRSSLLQAQVKEEESDWEDESEEDFLVAE